MKEHTDNLIKGLRRIAHAMSIHSKQVHEAHRVTLPQWFCLVELSKKDSMPLSDLTGPLALNNSTVTGIVDRLEKNGLVARMRVGGDRRKVHVALTEDGCRLVTAAPIPVHDALVQSLMAIGLEELVVMVKVIDRLAGILESTVDARKSPL